MHKDNMCLYNIRREKTGQCIAYMRKVPELKLVTEYDEQLRHGFAHRNYLIDESGKTVAIINSNLDKEWKYNFQDVENEFTRFIKLMY